MLAALVAQRPQPFYCSLRGIPGKKGDKTNGKVLLFF